MSKENFVGNVTAVANVIALTKLSVQKLGFEYIAPMDEVIQNEKISKAILQHLRSADDKE